MGYPRESLKIQDWPALDQKLWFAASRPVDLVDDAAGGRAAGWRPKTKLQVAKDYGRLMHWLRARGELEEDVVPGVRLTPSRLEGYVSHLQQSGMASTSLLSRIRNLLQAIRVMDADADLAALRRLCAKLKARAVPRRDKASRLRDSAEIVHAALALYDELSAGRLSMRPAGHARDALMVAFLAHIPLRLGSFTQLRIGQHLRLTSAGMTVALSGDEVKEGIFYEADVPDALLPYLKHYLAVIRPQLLRGRQSDALWVSMRGDGMADSAVYYQITKMTKRLLGGPIPPHFLRDCAMTGIATDMPANVHAGARLLGHRDPSTSNKHYNHAQAAAAQRQYFEVLRKLRSEPSERDAI